MTTKETDQVDWKHWLQRWDAQQAGYVPEREERFRVMLDVLEALLPDEFVALDLACGPGAISQRLLERFPGARCVAIDFDPVMLALGQGAVGTFDGRLRWIDADLAEQDWVRVRGRVGRRCRTQHNRPALAIGTASRRALPRARRVGAARRCVPQRRQHGLRSRSAHRPAARAGRQRSRLVGRIVRGARSRNGGAVVGRSWAGAIHGTIDRGAHATLASKERPASSPTFDLHVGALRDAGFREVATVWQSGTDRVLLAVR